MASYNIRNPTEHRIYPLHFKERYLDTVPSARRTLAHDEEIGLQRDQYTKLSAKSEPINDPTAHQDDCVCSLFSRRVPDMISRPAIVAGDNRIPSMLWPSVQTMRAIVVNLFEAAGTDRYQEILGAGKVLSAVEMGHERETSGAVSLEKEQLD